MPSIGNQRVSQLVELTSNEAQPDDVMMIVDITARESKQILLSELANWLNYSGSFFIEHAFTADTASYVLASGVVGTVASASYAIISGLSLTSITASQANLAAYAITASYALNGGGGGTPSQTASYLQYSGGPNGTASYAIISNLSNTATVAYSLFYNGSPNGTQSFSMVANSSSYALNSDTASYLNAAVASVASASYSITSSYVQGSSVSSSYLTFSPNNGTASFALSAQTVSNILGNFGVQLAYTQSRSSSIIDTVTVSSSFGTPQLTIIEANGNAIISYTSSVHTPCSLSLVIQDRFTGNTTVLDSSPMEMNLSPQVSPITGTISVPFSLIGETLMYGEYYTQVTSSSPGVAISTNRTTRFSFASYSDVLTTQADEPIQFYLDPSASVLITFSSSIGGPFQDYLPGLLATGSQNITWISVNSQSVDDIRYTWTLSSLNYFDCSNNPALNYLLYSFSPTLDTLICDSCNISTIPDLYNTSMSYLDISNNQITDIPSIPATMSYLNISNNLISNFAYLTQSITSLYANDLSASIIFAFPPSIVTGSFSGSFIESLPSNVPNTMTYLDLGNTLISSIPILSVSMSFLNISYADLVMSDLENATGQLVSNGMISGTLNIQGYGPVYTFSPTLLANVVNLVSNSGWTILYDAS